MRVRVRATMTSKEFIVEIDPRRINEEIKREAKKIIEEMLGCHKYCARLVGTWDCHRICDDNEFYGALEIARKIGRVGEFEDYDKEVFADDFLWMIVDW